MTLPRQTSCLAASRLRRAGVAALALAAGASTVFTTLTPADTRGPAFADASTARVATDDLVANPSVLGRVPAKYRPKFRWWWPTDALDKTEIDAELSAMKEAGFAGVEQITLRNDKSWGTPAFVDTLRYSLTKAKELGLEFDITLGPGWPVTSPAVNDISKDLSSQDLGYGAVDVVGGTTYSGAVPDNAAPTASSHRRLVAVTAAKVVSASGTSRLVLDPESAVDLTGKVATGSIEWTAPADGTWKLFGFWMRPTMQVVKLGTARGTDLVVDYLNRDAVDTALESFDTRALDAVADLLRENGGDVFEDSLELAHGPVPAGQSAVFWTGDMLRDFQVQQDYSVTRLLPGLFAEIAFTRDDDDRLKNDFRDTLNELLVTDHYQPIEAWVAEKGLTFRAQAYQGDGQMPTDARRLARTLPKPDVESLGFGDPNTTGYAPGGPGPRLPGTGDSRAVLDRYRQVVSGAHLSGVDEISNELGASLFGDHRTGPADLKQLADHSFAAGVSRVVLHGFAYKDYTEAGKNTWMGWCPWCGRISYADSWNQDWPQFKALSRFVDYSGRAGAVLRTGRPQVDLVVLDVAAEIDGTQKPDPAGTPEDDFRKALSGAGFTWDSISPEDLLTTGQVRNGRLLPEGPAYKALVVHDQAALPAATAEQLVDLARAGLPLVVHGAVPSRGTSMLNPDQEDALVQAALATLRTLGNVRFQDQSGAVAGALAGLRVHAELAGDIVEDVVPVHRRTASGDAWFLYNNSTQPVDGELTFTTRGAPSSVDLWTGQVTELGHYDRDGDTVTVPVRIDAEDTAVVLFDERAPRNLSVVSTDADEVIRVGNRLVARDDQSGQRTFTMSNGSTLRVTLPHLPTPATPGSWHLVGTTTAPTGSTNVDLTLDTLKDWKDIPDLKGKSGTGLYTTQVTLTDDWFGGDRGARLRLGDFGGAVRVWVNGKEVLVSEVPNANQVDVTTYLRPGGNDLTVELSTTLNNALRAAAQAGNPDYTNSFWALRPELPAGLKGPVELVPFGQIEVN